MGIFKKKKPKYADVQMQELRGETLEERNASYAAMREEEVNRVREAYNVNTVRGIRSIPVPCFEPNGRFSSTGKVEYVLRNSLAHEHYKAGRNKLAKECILKAHDLMFISDMIWKRDAFLSDIRFLKRLGYNRVAKKQQNRVERHFKKLERKYSKSFPENTYEMMRVLKTDLLQTSYIGACCETCAKYRARIFSLKGKDKRFPKLPKDFHYGCGVNAGAFVYGIHEPTFSYKGDLITYCNRPFVDDRTEEEKQNYITRLAKIKQQQKGLEQREGNHTEYEWVAKHLPELCPKSLSGYTRMKNSNSENFQKIAAAALAKGKKL